MPVLAWAAGSSALMSGEPSLAIIDTGVCPSQVDPIEAPLHGAFVSKIDNNSQPPGRSGELEWQWDFLENDALPQDLSGHGTHVSGIVWRQLTSHRSPRPACLVMLRAGRDRLGGPQLVEALRRVGKLRSSGRDVAVLLCAFTLEREDTEADVFEAFRREAAALMTDGLIIVAAAGGTGANLDQLPADRHVLPACIKHPNLVVVTSCSRDGQLAPRSNTGPTQVAVAAPGTRIDSCWLEGGRKRLSGTSQAAALVAADVLDGIERAKAAGREFRLDAFLSTRGRYHPSLLQTTRSGRYWVAAKAAEAGGGERR